MKIFKQSCACYRNIVWKINKNSVKNMQININMIKDICDLMTMWINTKYLMSKWNLNKFLHQNENEIENLISFYLFRNFCDDLRNQLLNFRSTRIYFECNRKSLTIQKVHRDWHDFEKWKINENNLRKNFHTSK